MAKPGKQPPKVKTSAPKSGAKPSVSPIVDYLERPPVDAPAEARIALAFRVIAAAGLVLMIALSMGSGINADDKFQVDYSQKLVNYYATAGKDTAALHVPEGNMHYYGGFFEVVTGAVNRTLGLEPGQLGYHQVRNACSAALGWVAILCVSLLARSMAGWHAALFTLIMMLLSPRFLGDSLMNPKDIPFAAGYAMALYGTARVLTAMPRPKWSDIAILTGGLGIALAMRAGGLLPFAIFALFAGLHFLMKNGMFRALSNTALLGKYAAITIGVCVVGYALALAFWPYAMQAPLSNPFIALSKFAELEVKIRVLFEGENMMSDKTPWYYPVKWMAITIPLGVLLGAAGALLRSPHLLRKYNPLLLSMTAFAAVFPVFYVVYKNSVIHDGWRHLTFAYPPLVALAGIFWSNTVRSFPDKALLRNATVGVFFLLMADAGLFILKHPTFPYVYFNPLVGGTSGAYGKYETDYWGVSVRQGLDWMAKEGIIRKDMTDTVVIATNMYYAAKQLTAPYGDKVAIKYVKWEKRCDMPWDYALFPTRFIDGATLKRNLWPPDNAVHVVKAGSAPLLAVLRSDGYDCHEGMEASKRGDWPSAIAAFEQTTAKVPDDDLAWVSLAQAYLNNNQLDEAKMAAEKCLDISPDDAQANNLIGLYWLNKGDVGQAKSQFETSIKREANNPAAWYYLALIARSSGDQNTALNNLNKAIQLSPNFKPAYEMAAQIHETSGNASAAQQLRAVMQQLR